MDVVDDLFNHVSVSKVELLTSPHAIVSTVDHYGDITSVPKRPGRILPH